MSATHEVAPVGLMLAVALGVRERNRPHVRDMIGADSGITAKRGKADWKNKGTRAQMRRPLPRQRYS